MAQSGDLIERAILEICRDVCELPDRSSPEGEPDQVIVTLEELSDICRNVLTEALSAIPIPAPTGGVERALLAVVEATRAYLPPDGIDAQECLNRILAATDNPKINPFIREMEQS